MTDANLYDSLLAQLDPSQVTQLLGILNSGGLDDSFWGPVAPEYVRNTGKLACDIALAAAHLWNMPAVVRNYLTTQDESLKEPAYTAASKYVDGFGLSLPPPFAAAMAAKCASSSTETPARCALEAAWWWFVAVTEERK